VEWVATMDTGSQAYYVSQRQPSILNVGDFYFNRGTISWIGTTGTSPSVTYAQNENFWSATPSSINMNSSTLTYYRIS